MIKLYRATTNNPKVLTLLVHRETPKNWVIDQHTTADGWHHSRSLIAKDGGYWIYATSMEDVKEKRDQVLQADIERLEARIESCRRQIFELEQKKLEVLELDE